jgi:hypothetical protein
LFEWCVCVKTCFGGSDGVGDVDDAPEQVACLVKDPIG